MITFCNSYVLWLLRCVQLRLVTVTFCDVNVVWCYVLSQHPQRSWVRILHLSNSWNISNQKNTEGIERLYCKRQIQCLASSKVKYWPSPARTLPPLVRGEDTLAGWRGGGGTIFWKTPDTALYSTYVSTLWLKVTDRLMWTSKRRSSYCITR